jgi:hypothetical protein
VPEGFDRRNRQIRSQLPHVPGCLPFPYASPLVLVNGDVLDPGRTPVPTRHLRHGGNVVAVSGRRRQTRRLATGRRRPGLLIPEHQIPDLVLWAEEVQPIPPTEGSILRRLLCPPRTESRIPACRYFLPAFVSLIGRRSCHQRQGARSQHHNGAASSKRLVGVHQSSHHCQFGGGRSFRSAAGLGPLTGSSSIRGSRSWPQPARSRSRTPRDDSTDPLVVVL